MNATGPDEVEHGARESRHHVPDVAGPGDQDHRTDGRIEAPGVVEFWDAMADRGFERRLDGRWPCPACRAPATIGEDDDGGVTVACVRRCRPAEIWAALGFGRAAAALTFDSVVRAEVLRLRARALAEELIIREGGTLPRCGC